MARKCWALKVRQFLRLKAELFGVTVATEPELLSLLSTSDIKAVGAEVLLTWGGAALAGITHPQVGMRNKSDLWPQQIGFFFVDSRLI
jgi:hypothetical protein